MRAASDLHLTPATADLVWAALDVLRLDAEKHGGPTVLAGDILEQPKSVDMPTYNRLRAELRRFPDEVYVLPGNHDQYAGWENALEALEGDNVQVVSHPRITPFGLMVPYVDPQEWRAIVDGFDIPDDMRIVWAHQGFRSAYQNRMTRDRDGVQLAGLERVIVTGHYHMPQNLGRVIYCGSPYQTSFAEEGQVKGFLRWADWKADPIPERVPYGRIGPHHWTVRWDPEAGNPERPAGFVEGDRLRIVTTATRKEVQSRAKALKAAGMDGAAIVATPAALVSGRGIVARDAGPREAVDQYLDGVFGPDPKAPHPDDMRQFAAENELWGG